MKRVGTLLAGMLLLAMVLVACNPFEPPAYTDDSQPINVGVGDEFAIGLASNPTTGYEWGVSFDSKMLSQAGKSYNSSLSPPGMVGAGGTDRFTFKALAAGTTDLKFKYYRTFEPATIPPIQTKTFKVIVK